MFELGTDRSPLLILFEWLWYWLPSNYMSTKTLGSRRIYLKLNRKTKTTTTSKDTVFKCQCRRKLNKNAILFDNCFLRDLGRVGERYMRWAMNTRFWINHSYGEMLSTSCQRQSHSERNPVKTPVQSELGSQDLCYLTLRSSLHHDNRCAGLDVQSQL